MLYTQLTPQEFLNFNHSLRASETDIRFRHNEATTFMNTQWPKLFLHEITLLHIKAMMSMCSFYTRGACEWKKSPAAMYLLHVFFSGMHHLEMISSGGAFKVRDFLRMCLFAYNSQKAITWVAKKIKIRGEYTKVTIK